MVNFEGMFKLSDFRYSRLLDSPVEHVDEAVGTEAYYSPELKSSTEKKRIGCFTDIWCLGLTLYQMCAASESATQPFKIHESYSSGLSRMIDWMLNKDYTSRPSAQDILSIDWFTQLNIDNSSDARIALF